MKKTFAFTYPKNFREKDKNIFYFLNTPETFNEPGVKELKDFSFHVGSGQLLSGGLKDAAKKMLASAGVKFRQIKVSEPLVWFSTPYAYNYGHWFNDFLPSLMLMEEKGLKGKIIFREMLRPHKFLAESLDLLGWDYEFYEPNTIITGERLYFPERTAASGSQHPVYFNQLIHRLTAAAGCQPLQPFRKIFIARKGTLDRKVEPMAEVEAILKEFDFEIRVTDHLSFKDQIILYWECKELMSAHGGGLTNMAYMQPGGKIIEVRRDDDQLNYCFVKMANVCQHHYYYLLGRGKMNTANVLHDDYIIQTDELLPVLKAQ